MRRRIGRAGRDPNIVHVQRIGGFSGQRDRLILQKTEMYVALLLFVGNDRLRDQHRRRLYRDVDRPVFRFRHRRHLSRQLFELRQELLEPRIQESAVFRELDIPSAMDKQRHSQLFFQISYCFGQGRLCNMKPLRAFCHMFRFGDLPKVDKLLQFHGFLLERFLLSIEFISIIYWTE